MLLLRYWLQVCRAAGRNPLSQFAQSLTNFVVVPARRVIPGLFGTDLSTVVLAWLTLVLELALTLALRGHLPESGAGVGLLWASAAWSFGVDYLHAFPQRQVAAHEFNSDGYRLLGATASRVLKFGALEAEAFLRATNLADREARPHTSLLKDLAPLPGRSVTAGVRFSF